MALRLGSYLIEGQISNTSSKSVHGQLLLRGKEQPLQIELTGNCQPDLQGCTVRFRSGEVAREQIARLEGTDPDNLPEFTRGGIAVHQVGTTGTITANQWGKVLQIPVEEAMDHDGSAEDLPIEWHRRFYMEWFSQNGRIVLEIPDPQLEFLEGEDPWNPEEHPPPEETNEGELWTAGPDMHIVTPDSIDHPDQPGEQPPQEEDNEDRSDENLEEYIRKLVDNPDRTAFLNEPDDPMEETRLIDHLIEQGEGKPFCTLLEEPDRLPDPDQLNEEEARKLVKAMLTEMAFHNVALHICEHFSYHDTYRLLIDELLTDQFYYSQLQGTGWTTNYMTAEFCDVCEKQAQKEFEQSSDNETEVTGAIQLFRQKLNHLDSLFDEPPAQTATSGYKMLPGVSRTRSLVPVIVQRLEEDLLAKNIRIENEEAKNLVVKGLRLLKEGVEGMYQFYKSDRLTPVIEQLEDALELEEQMQSVPSENRPGRFINDLLRTSPEFRIFRNILKNMQSNRMRTPTHPPEEQQNNPEAWYTFFEEKLMYEEPLIRIPAIEGLSNESIQEAWEAQQEQSDQIREEGKRFVEFDQQDRYRDQIFNSERPEAFLNMDPLPEPGDVLDETDPDPSGTSDSSDSMPDPEPPSELLDSLPELEQWNHHRNDPETDSLQNDSTTDHITGENDPVKTKLLEFTGTVDDHLEGDLDTWPPEYHYIRLLSMKPGVRIAGSYAFVEDEKLSFAPVHGAYLHAIRCLKRIIGAIDTFNRTELTDVRTRCTELIHRIEQELR